MQRLQIVDLDDFGRVALSDLGGVGIRPVEEELHARGPVPIEIAGEVVLDDDAGIERADVDRAAERLRRRIVAGETETPAFG